MLLHARSGHLLLCFFIFFIYSWEIRLTQWEVHVTEKKEIHMKYTSSPRKVATTIQGRIRRRRRHLDSLREEKEGQQEQCAIHWHSLLNLLMTIISRLTLVFLHQRHYSRTRQGVLGRHQSRRTRKEKEVKVTSFKPSSCILLDFKQWTRVLPSLLEEVMWSPKGTLGRFGFTHLSSMTVCAKLSQRITGNGLVHNPLLIILILPSISHFYCPLIVKIISYSRYFI